MDFVNRTNFIRMSLIFICVFGRIIILMDSLFTVRPASAYSTVYDCTLSGDDVRQKSLSPKRNSSMSGNDVCQRVYHYRKTVVCREIMFV